MSLIVFVVKLFKIQRTFSYWFTILVVYVCVLFLCFFLFFFLVNRMNWKGLDWSTHCEGEE